MSKRLIVWVAVAGMVALMAGSALAQTAPASPAAPAAKKPAATKKADATVKLSEGEVAVGIGWSWGKGVLTYKGKTYPFKVEGLTVGEVGVTKAEATGEVFNLTKLEDFGGVYRAASAEATADKGKGVTTLQNGAGVNLHLKSTTKGASLKLAVEGLKLTLAK